MIVQGQGVLDWIAERTGDDFGKLVVGIGEQREGKLVAGASFADYNGVNVVVALAADEPPSRGYWHAIFSYAFETLGCGRITTHVEESNIKSVKLTSHLGFEVETRLKGAGSDGSDYLLFCMWKENCRQLKWGRNHGI